MAFAQQSKLKEYFTNTITHDHLRPSDLSGERLFET